MYIKNEFFIFHMLHRETTGSITYVDFHLNRSKYKDNIAMQNTYTFIMRRNERHLDENEEILGAHSVNQQAQRHILFFCRSYQVKYS